MTKTTGERMTRIETQIESIKEDLSLHCVNQRADFDKVFKKIDEIPKSISSGFAGKWVEKVAIGSLVGVIAGIIVLLIQII